ncbi:hypothetical protein WN943_013872 [Citrus x changshan-huyou]
MCCDKRYLFSLLQVDDQGRRLGKRRRQFPNSSRQHLKVVELHGFLGVSLILKLRLTCCKLLPHGIELVVSEVKLCSFESKDIVYCYVQSRFRSLLLNYVPCKPLGSYPQGEPTQTLAACTFSDDMFT